MGPLSLALSRAHQAAHTGTSCGSDKHIFASTQFTFTHVLDNASQQAVYAVRTFQLGYLIHCTVLPTAPRFAKLQACGKEIVSSVLDGYNGTILAYGQTVNCCLVSALFLKMLLVSHLCLKPALAVGLRQNVHNDRCALPSSGYCPLLGIGKRTMLDSL